MSSTATPTNRLIFAGEFKNLLSLTEASSGKERDQAGPDQTIFSDAVDRERLDLKI